MPTPALSQALAVAALLSAADPAVGVELGPPPHAAPPPPPPAVPDPDATERRASSGGPPGTRCRCTHPRSEHRSVGGTRLPCTRRRMGEPVPGRPGFSKVLVCACEDFTEPQAAAVSP